jgi:hypothetical protein
MRVPWRGRSEVSDKSADALLKSVRRGELRARSRKGLAFFVNLVMAMMPAAPLVEALAGRAAGG